MKGANRSSNHVVQIPEDIILEILKELLAKSLLRFKCVSKGWCNMIEDPEFVAFAPAAPTSSFTRIYLKSIGEFVLVDSKGISVPVAIPDIIVKEYYSGNFLRMHDVVRPVIEGLVCFNDFVWNPSVRKIINLPLRKVKERRDIITGFVSYEREFGNENFLGFDASTRKCKVLGICRTLWIQERPYRCDRKSRVNTKILTLGTNSWRSITNCFLPEHLRFQFRGFRWINSVIYFRMTFEQSILAFDLIQEKFQLIPAPDDDKICRMVEVRECLGLMNSHSTKIWILEDFENRKWNVVNILWPSCWIVDPFNYPYCENDNSKVIPVGSIQTGEIHCKSIKRRNSCCLSYFDSAKVTA